MAMRRWLGICAGVGALARAGVAAEVPICLPPDSAPGWIRPGAALPLPPSGAALAGADAGPGHRSRQRLEACHTWWYRRILAAAAQQERGEAPCPCACAGTAAPPPPHWRADIDRGSLPRRNLVVEVSPFQCPGHHARPGCFR